MTTTISTSLPSSSNTVAEVAVAQAGGRHLQIRCSTRDDGDFHRFDVPFAELEARRRGFVDLPWIQLDERHGIGVVHVDSPDAGDGSPGDVAVTHLDGVVLGCWVGDCAPIVLVGAQRQFAVVHAGWRGLAAGVVGAALEAFDEPIIAAVLGPTIGPCCYEFGPDDLDAVAGGLGVDPSRIVGVTHDGAPALDVPAAVQLACGDVGLRTIGACTGCRFPGFSHRVRRDPQRHVVAAWRQAL